MAFRVQMLEAFLQFTPGWATGPERVAKEALGLGYAGVGGRGTPWGPA